MSEVTPQIVNPSAQPEVIKTDAPAVTPPIEAPKESNSMKFDALARREKQAIQRMRMAKQKEAELAQKEAQIKSWEESKQKAKLNPDRYLEEAGLTYDDLVNYKLNGGKVTPELEIKDVRSQLEQFKKQQEEQRNQELEKSKQQKEREANETIMEFKEEIHDYLSQNPDQYELTLLYSSENLVYDTIAEHWQRGVEAYNKALANGENPIKPKVLSKKEAGDLVEKYLEDLLDKAKSTKKWAGKYGGPQKEEPQAKQSNDIGSFKPSIKTLSNDISGPATPSSAFVSNRSEADAMKRALAKLSGG